ncbi:NADH-quinone oxidoreductase subunit NuoF [Candidatus Fokinia crypta]|nr:NADH-quinone oxidoreductase subunit NuoF [Candidatus Fokinia cryptica]
MIKEKNKIFKNIDLKASIDIKSSMLRGDWNGVQAILTTSDQVIQIVKESEIRGRGGAGFSTGIKWSFMPRDGTTSYVIVNADESEPGACKDKAIIRYEPHKIIEGALIAAFAVQARIVYIYVRGEYVTEASILENAIKEAEQYGLLGNNPKHKYSVNIFVHRGAGAYICGEESALLNSIEGRKGMPRIKPPAFPAVCGLYGCPTIVNNVETIASISTIMRRGANWYKSMGRSNNYGTKIFSISGHVCNPCNVEEEMSVPLKTLINEYAGGVIGGWDNLLAVIPGGSSTPLLHYSVCDDVLMDFDGLKSVGSALGTGSIIVMNKSADVIDAIANISRFYMHESCGQCTPCREGTGWMYRIMQRFVSGKAQLHEIYELYEITKQIEGRTICALGDAAAWPIQGLIKNFKDVIESRINGTTISDNRK